MDQARLGKPQQPYKDNYAAHADSLAALGGGGRSLSGSKNGEKDLDEIGP